MNNRIRELAEQAGFTVREESIMTLCRCWFGECYTVEAYCDEEVKKLTELIIQECGNALSPMLRDMISRGQAYELIKKHFGVE